MVKNTVNLLDSDARVADLINVENHEWKAELIEPAFNEEDAQLICSLPVSVQGANDKLMRIKSSNGMFSVKSAYFVDLEMEQHSRVQTSNDVSGEVQWKKIWHL